MNLLIEPWLPVRCRDGSRRWVSVREISDPSLLAFDADRPDFNAALTQFAIGLLQTSTSIANFLVWQTLLKTPPDAATLEEWFAPISSAFELNGDGARFMQDLSLQVDEDTANSIGTLLIEAPGENALKNNTDHFIKRGHVTAMCPACAATALLTLQINAPSGGAGHRTGLRGGGPLTTLILSHPPISLWQDLWLNLQESSAFLSRGGDASKRTGHFTFPWLADLSLLQKKGGEVAPMQVHPAHVFWAMPRRIRLDFSDLASGECDICRRGSESLVRKYATKNHGLNYKGPWHHPLSPYYETKECWLPLHPQAGGFGYRHWLSWVFGLNSERKKQRPAEVVDHFLEHRREQTSGQLRLWAFGFDMDNMKARCWYESSLPLYGLSGCDRDHQRQVESEVGYWLRAAELAAFYLKSAAKDAWFSSDSRGDLSFIDASFWSRTQPTFYGHLKDLIEAAREERDFDQAFVRDAWHQSLTKAAIRLFDNELVGAEAIERQNPRRAAMAFQQLRRNLKGPKIRQALGLPPLKTGRPKASEGAARQAS